MHNPELLNFRASSFSNGGNGCVEPAPHAAGVTVRDSKDPDGPRLEFTYDQWDLFMEELRNGAPFTNGAVNVTTETQMLVYGGVSSETCWHLHSTQTDVVLHYTRLERDAFRLGARAGEFTFQRPATVVEPSAA